MTPRYPFVAVDVPAVSAEEVSCTLFDLGASGVEERDDQTLAVGPGKGMVTLVASFADHTSANDAIAALQEEHSDLAPRLEEVVGDAWRDAWKEHFAPFALTRDIVVVPPWVTERPKEPGQRILELEPGRAFGTGLHATTALVAESLDAHRSATFGQAVLDVGTGSGILALVALTLGASRAVAIDTDQDVIEVVLENAKRNGFADRISATHASASSIKERFCMVLANIEARVLCTIAADLAATVAKKGTLVLSGVLAPEHDTVIAAFLACGGGLRHTTTRRRGEGDDAWVAIEFERA